MGSNGGSGAGGLINLRSAREIGLLRQAGGVVAEALQLVRQTAQVGVTTAELDRAVEDLIVKRGALPLFKGVPGNPPFPNCVCASVNEEVVHGIPGPRKLRDGDILSIDVGCRLNGYCGDSATTVPIGAISPDVADLLRVTERSLEIAIEQIPKCRMWTEVAGQMADYVRSYGFSMVERFVGHGIGTQMHERPEVPNFVPRNYGSHDFKLTPGLVLAIEPMVNMGTKKVRSPGRDGWTVVTADGRPSAHFEHTVAVVEGGVSVLTRPPGD